MLYIMKYHLYICLVSIILYILLHVLKAINESPT